MIEKIKKRTTSCLKLSSKFFGDHPVLFILGAALMVAVFTTIVYLSRAGSGPGHNWPALWNLSNSDNSVLFQLSQDIFKGRGLDWSFSPQVYIFPEIPISLVAYALSLGNPYWYFIMVAVLNNIHLFVVLSLLFGLLNPKSDKIAVTKGGLAATIPLIILPLIATNTVFAYHLAPTYYFGAYLLAFAFPLTIWAKNRAQKSVFAIFYIITAASNPLLIVFTLPAYLVVTVVKFMNNSLKNLAREFAYVAGLVMLSFVVRLAFFSGIVGTSPANYISIEHFAKRLGGLRDFILYSMRATVDPVLAILSAGSTLIVVLLFIATIKAYVTPKRTKEDYSEEYLPKMYLLVFPLTAVLSLYFVMVLNTLYLWIIIVGPFVVLFLLAPKRYSTKLVLVGYGLILLAVFTPKGVTNLSHTSNYFRYTTPVARCVDSNQPAHSVGYATFSDARKASVTSSKDILLVPILPAANPTGWLTNKAYVKDYAGSFFVINKSGAETPIDRNIMRAEFGNPSHIVDCGGGITIYQYTGDVPLKRIDQFYNSMYQGYRSK